MPNRILKESICRSDSIDSLSWFEEVLFYRLIVNCDDFGRYDGRASIIKGSLFPLRSITNKQIEDGLKALATAGMVYLYNVEGKPFLQLVNWENHQTIRAKKSKYPEYKKENDLTCKQMQADDCKCPRNPIQSESESNSDNILLGANVAPSPEPVISLLLNDKSFFDVSEEQLKHYEELYPSVNIMQQLRIMKGWIENNPKKRKTKSGIGRFIANWLAKEQNRGGNNSSQQKIIYSDDDYQHKSDFFSE